MSIKTKLSIACALLILVNVAVGVFSQASQQRIAAVGIDIYDRAFMAMSYLRSSQNGLSRLRAAAEAMAPERGEARRDTDPRATAGSGAPNAIAQDGGERLRHEGALVRSEDDAQPWARMARTMLPDVVSDVEVAHDRAMSQEGAAATRDLAARLSTLKGEFGSRDLAQLRVEIDRLQADFDAAVEIYAGDGYRFRRKVQGLVDNSTRQVWTAMASSVLVALAITLALWASIVPALRSAVGIARAVSAGKLDSMFPSTGSDETAVLLRALSDMKDSLVDKIGRIDALAVESRARAAELEIQSGRFEAALDNMHHGLCMVDANHRLLVANHRFTEMFGPPELGGDAMVWPLFPNLNEWLDACSSSTEALPDGRHIRVASQPVREGGWVVTFEDVTDRQRAASSLYHMSRHDALTGLPNRVAFRERLEDMLADDRPFPGPTVLYVDLDGFKTINDTLGHAVGDELLRGVALRLQHCLESPELIARLGGDEFAVILRSDDPGSAEHGARELLGALSQPFDLSSRRVAIGASIGIAIWRGSVDDDVADVGSALLKQADLALYSAKAEGKGTYRFHSEEMQSAISERRDLEADLRVALDRNEFVILFQPIVDASGHDLKGFEALIRWHHPVRGIVSPALFIPIAEEAGLITAIGRWVLRQSCIEAATWPGDVKVAVNLSAVQFSQGFLAADVLRALADARLAPHRLELEITESVLIQDSASVVATLKQLRTLGVRIALDDFGTGYSSLSYLRQFPFDKLKIDRSFVQTLSNADDVAILRAMIGLGRSLNVAVVAEGIESADQAERLRDEGCTELQGFFFGRPGPANEVADAIQRLDVSRRGAPPPVEWAGEWAS